MAELVKLRAEALKRFSDLAFAQETRAPDLERRFGLWARRVLPKPRGALPFSVNCRGTTCVLAPQSPGDIEEALK